MWGAATVFAVLVLWGGTQLAIARGQDVAWYTGFGQWLGALGSLIAAAVALGIATTDRRQAAKLRTAEQDDRDADLAREAGLVRIQIEHVQDGVPQMPVKAITVRNWRQSRLFEVELVRIAVTSAQTKAEIGSVRMHFPNGRSWGVNKHDVKLTPIDHGMTLWVFPMNGAVPKYGALQYTDEAGRRWEVDTKGIIARKL